MSSKDIYLDLLVDEYQVQRQWLTTVLDEPLTRTGPDPDGMHSDASAAMVCDGALAVAVAGLSEDLRVRLARRLHTSAFTADPARNEAVLYENTFTLLSTLRAGWLAENAGRPEIAAELAAALVLQLHERMGECVWLLEKLANVPEGELARRTAIRDRDLADRAYSEAGRVFPRLRVPDELL